jgi:adenosine deaminase
MHLTPPTAELHVHLEGTLEPEAIFAMAASNGMVAPAESIDALRAKYEFDDLQSFLDIYYSNLDVVRTADDFYAMTDAYLRRAAAGNVRRAEMFFDPQSHLRRGIRAETMLEGITAAMRNHPEVSTGLIMCFLRHLGPEEAIDTYRLMAPHVGDIVGVGLDSTELGYPNHLFSDVFAMARADGLHAVAHAGEEGGPDNIVASLDVLGAERIDHGVRCLEDDRLVDRLVVQQIPLTVCPQSNVRLKVVSTMSDHPLPRMLGLGLCVTVNSDDPAYFGGYVDDNYRDAASALGLTSANVRTLAENSFAASFLEDEDRAGFLADVADYFAGDG